ncbi:hypothetical protein ACF3NT_11925 [Naumannella halotolerans]|uniref:Uncharacterized protein n=1 Tax=Naumannella halotolerans TaxID=993414 RepID=A0A4R7J3V6_9ACTN|nr:hypothetical protein [Naumannella halotolerans]TDT31216.1 hypothetical protein CLV29_2630 [Naumannella halotolerans]
MGTRVRKHFAALMITLALTGTGLVAGAPTADAAPTKKCVAKMSVSKPKQYSKTDVLVSKVGSGAKVTTVAKYSTTQTKKTATAGSKGTASLRYNISGAKPKYKVVVSVTAKKGKTTWKCSTSFIPQKR